MKFNSVGVSYTREFSNGNYEGYGIKYIQGQKVYQGSFINNNYNGYSILYKDNNIEYEGIWVNNIRDTVINEYKNILIEYAYEIDISSLLEVNDDSNIKHVF